MMIKTNFVNPSKILPRFKNKNNYVKRKTIKSTSKKEIHQKSPKKPNTTDYLFNRNVKTASFFVSDALTVNEPPSIKYNIAMKEILSGITVALTLVPETIAFALVCGVSPVLGLHTTAIASATSAIFGGRPGMISGAAGALAVVSSALVQSHGKEYLFACVLLMGIIQLSISTLKLGKFASLVPRSVVLGFCTGLSIIIGKSQLHHFTHISGKEFWQFTLLVAIGVSIIEILPKITNKFPSSLISVGLITMIVKSTGIHTETVADLAPIIGGFPSFHIPQVPITYETLLIIFPYAGIMAMIGFVEAVLTVKVLDESTNSKGNMDKEFFGQSLSNIFGGLMRNQGACAMIVPSNLNTKSGGRTWLSSMSCSIGVLLTSLVPGFIASIPTAALVATLLTVCFHTFSWNTWLKAHKIPKSDFAVVFVTAYTIVNINLAAGFFFGIALSAINIAWKMSHHVKVSCAGNSVFIKGSIYFGSASKVKEALQKANITTIDMKHSSILDGTAAHIFTELALLQENKQIRLTNLDSCSIELMLKNESGVFEDDGSFIVKS